MNNIYLCGFMGTGKSYIGKLVSDKLKRELIDSDEYIELWKSKKISQIFKDYGEDVFRETEHQAICRLSEKKQAVISLGGGAVLREDNVFALKNSGKVFLLDTPFDTCYERIAGDINRPISAKKSKQELYELFCNRAPFYKNAADVVIDTNGLNADQIVDLIIKNI